MHETTDFGWLDKCGVEHQRVIEDSATAERLLLATFVELIRALVFLVLKTLDRLLKRHLRCFDIPEGCLLNTEFCGVEGGRGPWALVSGGGWVV